MGRGATREARDARGGARGKETSRDAGGADEVRQTPHWRQLSTQCSRRTAQRSRHATWTNALSPRHAHGRTRSPPSKQTRQTGPPSGAASAPPPSASPPTPTTLIATTQEARAAATSAASAGATPTLAASLVGPRAAPSAGAVLAQRQRRMDRRRWNFMGDRRGDGGGRILGLSDAQGWATKGLGQRLRRGGPIVFSVAVNESEREASRGRRTGDAEVLGAVA